jgi:hypothetical protein
LACRQILPVGGDVIDAGVKVLTEFGVDLSLKRKGKRIFCKPCLDWSERRHHIARHVGAEIQRRCMELSWLIRVNDTRAVQLTIAGQTGLRDTFGLDELDLRIDPPNRRAGV